MSRDPEERIDPARRDFLLGRVFRPSNGSSEPRLGPLPPCIGEADRSGPSSCHGCDAPCIASCEEGIIFRHPESHALAEVAYLSFEHKGCTYCGDCRDACPACSDPIADPPNLGLALLDESECMAWDSVLCRTCAFACPERAIAFDQRNRPSVISDDCNGCGICVPVCPSKALEISDLEYLRGRINAMERKQGSRQQEVSVIEDLVARRRGG